MKTITNTVLKLAQQIKDFDFESLDEGCVERTFKEDDYELVFEISVAKDAVPVKGGKYRVEIYREFNIEVWDSNDDEVELTEHQYNIINKVLDDKAYEKE